MLPRSVRHCICPPCRYGHVVLNGSSNTLSLSRTQHLRPLASGSIRYVRTRARQPIDFRKLVIGRAEPINGRRRKGPSLKPAQADAKDSSSTAQAPTLFTLSPSQKNELNVFDTFRQLMRVTAEKAAREASSGTQAMSVNQVIELVKPGTKGFRKVVHKLKSGYDGRPYEEVDRDLEAIMAFKSKSHVLSDTTEGILARLGFLNKRVDSDSASADKEKSSTPKETASEETLASKPDSVPEQKSDAPISKTPVAEQQSIVIETPEDFLELRPEQLLVAESQGTKKAPRHPYAPAITRRVTRRVNTEKFRTRLLNSDRAKKGGKIAEMIGDRVQVASGAEIPLTPMSMKTSEVPKLSHDLSRVLFNPGVYQLQDPRSRVWNFDPYLGNLMPVSEFNYDALNKYITSSEDVPLREVALQRGKRYIGSTSSMSGALAHFHFLLSAFRDLNLDNLSRSFDNEGHKSFTRIQKGPTAIFLRYKDGVYAVDADKEFDSANILMSLGRSMEKLLTSDREEYERYRRTEDATKDAEVKSTQPEAYHYSGLGQFLLRSQLDAYDPRLPGTGMFDLKTRAVAAVRMMIHDHEKGIGYQIKERFGTWESYEREYFDMMRSAFLKYSLQVRMGRMDGIFVAYHNTERLFGFQYVPLPEMDLALHGQSDGVLGDQEFSLSIQLLNYIFNEATMQHPGQSLRFHFEAREATMASPQFMYVFAEPVTEDEIVAIQNLKKDEIRAFEERIFNPSRKETSKTTQQSNAANVQFLDSILGIDINEAMAPKEKEAPASDSEGEVTEAEGTPQDSAPGKPLLAWKLNIRNLVNGAAVLRPEKLKAADTWSLQYTLNALSASEARRHYMLCKNRRKTMLEAPQDTDVAANFYLRRLVSMSRSGAEWRQRLDKLDAAKERIVLYGD